MFDKTMYDKICSVELSESELRDFCRGIDSREYDTVDSFEKYYSIDAILKCIGLYRAGKISDRYLANWANAYDRIITAQSRENGTEGDKTVSITTLLRWEISDWLDSLSFYDEDYMPKARYMDDYVKTFRALDELYKSRDSLRAFYAYADEYDCDLAYPFEDVYVLIVNEERREFIRIYSDGCNYQEYSLEAVLCDDPEALVKKAEELKNNGYSEIDYGFEYPDVL